MMKTILLIALVWILIAPKISDAQSPISITATLKWEINQELCPTTGHCGKIIRLSNDGQSLYILMVSSRQLYVIDGANQITQYDLSLVPGIEYEHFDYVPLDDDTILFLDPSPTAHALYSYHLSTATLSKFLPAHGFAACTSGINPPPRSFMRPLFSSHLLTCGTGSSDPDKIRNVSIVDLEMETIEEIAALEGMPRGGFEPWRRVTLGHDDAVYMQPLSLDLVRQYVTDFNSRYLTTEFILRRTAHQLDWTVIEITQRSVRENGGTATIGQLIGVDKQSNLYFYNSWSEADVARAQYTKTTSSGEVIWVITDLDFGSALFPIDITPDGEWIMLDKSLGSNQSTIGEQVVQYAIESELDTSSSISEITPNTDITATVKWEVNQELCPATGHCGQIIRLSNDGQSLYILMVSSRQLYVVDSVNQIIPYDLTLVPGISATDFDYIPYDQTTLLVLDTLSDNLYKYDLLSHHVRKIASSYRFVSCNNTTSNPPFHSFTRFGERDLLATCGRGSSSGDTYNLSIVNVTTETVQEIAALEGREGRSRSWRRITAGRDGFVYLQPGISDLLTTTVPDFQTQSIDYLLLLKRGVESEDWLPLQIPYQSLIESGITAAQLELLAVDAESNLYFMNWGSPDLIQYIKFNPQGDVEWAVNQGEFGSDISFLDVSSDGKLIMLDSGSADNQSTIGDQVVEYAIES